MQTRFGKAKSIRCYGEARTAKVASVFKIILLLLLSSCSHLNQSKPKISPQSAIKQLCLSGEGKGRVRFKSNKYLFGYSSQLDEKKEKWVLGMEMPVYGEEVVAFHYGGKSKGRVSGKFFRRLFSQTYQMKEGADNRKKLKRFLEKISDLLRLYLNPKDEDLKKFGEIKISQDGSLTIISTIEGYSNKFLVEGLRFNGEFYKLLRISMPQPQQASLNFSDSPLEINLFINDCAAGNDKT